MLQFPLYMIYFEEQEYECEPYGIFITDSLDIAKEKALNFALTKETQFKSGFNIVLKEVLDEKYTERTILYFTNDERSTTGIELMIETRAYNKVFDKKFEVLVDLYNDANITVFPYTSYYWPE